jgi:hypothetical protein
MENGKSKRKIRKIEGGKKRQQRKRDREMRKKTESESERQTERHGERAIRKEGRRSAHHARERGLLQQQQHLSILCVRIRDALRVSDSAIYWENQS